MIYLPVLITHKEALTAPSKASFNIWMLIVEMMAKLIILLQRPTCQYKTMGKPKHKKTLKAQNKIGRCQQ